MFNFVSVNITFLYICRVKNIVVVIALVFLLKPILPVLEYAINYDYISKTLCINKAKPKMHCNGKCHLMKELAKASESEKPISSDRKSSVKNLTEELFFQSIQSLIKAPKYFQFQKAIPNNYSNLYFFKIGCSIFHPPTFIS